MRFSASEFSGALCGRHVTHFRADGTPIKLALLVGGLLLAGCASDLTGPAQSNAPELAAARPIGGTGSSTAPAPIGGTGSSTR